MTWYSEPLVVCTRGIRNGGSLYQPMELEPHIRLSLLRSWKRGMQ